MARLPGAQVLFTTRRGGVSEGPFRSLNLGRLTEDRPEHVGRNRRLLQDRVGRGLAMVRQVHGSTVHLAEAAWPPADEEGAPPPAEGDGVVTARRDLAPAVLVADCLPVALAAQGAVAMLHAGWRGLASGVLKQGVRTLGQAGGGRPQAAIGPGIGACCYAVGEEVHQTFAVYGERVRQGQNLDLRAVARIQLEEMGVEVRHDLGLCTACSPGLFFSHRRDRGVTGRQAGAIWLT
jgi:YfiH family protein